MNKRKSHIKFLPANKIVEIKNESSVLELALKAKIRIESECGGSGSCGTCRVRLECQNLTPPERGEVELAMAKARNFDSNTRLACQIEPQEGMVIHIPDYDDDNEF